MGSRGYLIAFLGLAMPGFWLGIILIIVFGVQLNWLPVFGYTPISEGCGTGCAS